MPDRDMVTAHPLSWPAGWTRTRRPERARFGDCTVYSETRSLYDELGRMRVRERDIILSTNLRLRQDGLPYSNQRRPEDPGVAVYFKLKGEERVLACDRWDRVEHNIRAITKHIDALRGQERWGVGTLEQAFAGFTALPEHAGQRTCWQVLGIEPTKDAHAIKAAFRARARICHPDLATGSDEAMSELNAAVADAMKSATPTDPLA